MSKETIDTAELPIVFVIIPAYNEDQVLLETLSHLRNIQKSVLNCQINSLVVDNNSTDKTISEAKRAGAEVYNEPKQGYGACVHRCLIEAIKLSNDFDLMVLCEGDMTFRASDIDKLLSYIKNINPTNPSSLKTSR